MSTISKSAARAAGPGRLANLARNLSMYAEAWLRDLLDRRRRLFVGDYTYGRPIILSYFGDRASVYVGKYCSIARDVRVFLGGNHHPEWVSTFPFRIAFRLPGRYQDGQPWSKGDVRIGYDVWLCYGATIVSGITVGDGAVIAAHAVVTHDVPPYAIVGGNPARVLRYRFTPAQIEALLQIRWWDWPKEKVLASVDLLNSPDIDAFLARHRPAGAV